MGVDDARRSSGSTEVEERRLSVDAERLEGFLERVVRRNGDVEVSADERLVTVSAPATGTEVRLTVPFPPLSVDPREPWHGLVRHALTDRRIGLLLVRRGGYAAGVAEGTALSRHQVGRRHVQGRSAAGGSSQQRFARRRGNQADAAFAAAADCAARVLLPVVGTLDAVVVGGDRGGLDAVLADPRLAAIRAVVEPVRVAVGEPRFDSLRLAVRRARAVPVVVRVDGSAATSVS